MLYSRQIAFSLVALCGISFFAISRRRRRYLLNAVTDAENKDIISQLPDDILILIVERLWIKYATRMSILSKRWKNLFKVLPAISLSCEDLYGYFVRTPHDCGVIISCVDRLLRLRSGSKIHYFYFRCCLNKSYANKFEQCIDSLGKSGVEKLILQLTCQTWRGNYLFSCHLLSYMSSLKYFELICCSLQPHVNSQCNSLNTIRLSRVTAMPGSLECILSSCLSLQSLEIEHCRLPSKLCICGPNLQLKYFVIQICEGVEDIEFCASNLITFEFLSCEMVNFIFSYVPRLHSIYLSLYRKDVTPYVCGRLARDLPCLESLTFDIKRGFCQESNRYTSINVFNNLKRIELRLWCIHETSVLSLTPFLHSCPLLQELRLTTILLEYNGPRVEKHAVPHSQLKRVEISGFSGTQNEMDFALYMIKSAVNLEQMCISRCPKYKAVATGTRMKEGRPQWSEDTRKTIQKELQEQALSTTLQVIVQHEF